MVKIKVIFGEDACEYYEEHEDINKVQKYIRKHGGDFEELEFETEGEYLAYIKGLNDGNGWEEFWVIEKNGEKI